MASFIHDVKMLPVVNLISNLAKTRTCTQKYTILGVMRYIESNNRVHTILKILNSLSAAIRNNALQSFVSFQSACLFFSVFNEHSLLDPLFLPL